MRKNVLELAADEYINPADSLVYCRKCKKPRQMSLPFLGRNLGPRIACDCQKEAEAAENKARGQEERRRLISQLKSSGLGWKALEEYRFDKARYLDPEVIKTLKNFSSHYKDCSLSGLLLWGPKGSGKTFGAACIINDVLEECKPAVMVSFGSLLEELTGMNLQRKQNRLASIFSNVMICLDDFDLRYLTGLTIPLSVDLMTRVDHSSNPVIITTGYTLNELKHPQNELEQKLFGIILRKTAPICIDGEDLTGRIQQEHLAQLQAAR